MAQIDKLIDRILSDPRNARSSVLSDRVYKDEPILRPASRMSGYLPERYREMRALAKPAADARGYRRMSETRLFAAQARFMADWEDDCPYTGTFSRYFPTYNMMTDAQLRGYFTWRTQIRQGVVNETELSFAFVYAYELLNGVGAPDVRGCYDALRAFWEAYRGYSVEFDRFVRLWLRDYVVFYDLPSHLLEGLGDLDFERALIVLHSEEAACVASLAGAGEGLKATYRPFDVPDVSLNSEQRESALYDALATLSSYRIDRSRFAKAHLLEMHCVVSSVYRALVVHCARRRSHGFVDSLFGLPCSSPRLMFQSAVVALPLHPDSLYRVNAVHAYSCREGRWVSMRQYRVSGRNAELGDILQTIDRKMRRAFGDQHPLKERVVPRYVERAIDEAVDQLAQERECARKRQVVIDRSCLAGIRQRAADIREQLLVDEEREDGTPGAHTSEIPSTEPEGADVQTEVLSAPAVSAESASIPFRGSGSNDESPLDEAETAFVCAILDGVSTDAAVTLSGMTEDMLVDSVNEKLFDVLDDSALEYGPSGVQVIDDYRHEVEGVVRS